jgi:hypothetical protein
MATEYDPQYYGVPWTVDSKWILLATVYDDEHKEALRHLGFITNVSYTTSYQVSRKDKKGHAFKVKTKKGYYAIDPDEYMSFPKECDEDGERFNPYMVDAMTAMGDDEEPLTTKCSTCYYYPYYYMPAHRPTARTDTHPTPHSPQQTR